MTCEKAKLSKADAIIIEIDCRHLRAVDSAKEAGLTEMLFKQTYNRICLELRRQGAGKSVEGSRLFRAFCPRCLEPVRTVAKTILSMCRECDPPHRGVGYSAGGEIGNLLNDTEHDPDAYAPSWKQQ